MLFQTFGTKHTGGSVYIPFNIIFNPESVLTRLRLAQSHILAPEATSWSFKRLQARLIQCTEELPTHSFIITGLFLQGITYNFGRYSENFFAFQVIINLQS